MSEIITSGAVEDSVKYFQDGLYCSEAILKAFHERYDLGLNDEFLKIATSFGAGVGASKCLCGAVTGGVMVLSLVSGRSTTDQSEEASFGAAAKLHEGFRKDYKATCCKVLTRSVEWGAPEHHEHCVQFVRRTAELTEAILQQDLARQPKKIK